MIPLKTIEELIIRPLSFLETDITTPEKAKINPSSLIKDSFSKYSDKTAPYNKCREFIIPTDATATKLEAPPDNNCKKTIWEAPPKIMKDIAYTK